MYKAQEPPKSAHRLRRIVPQPLHRHGGIPGVLSETGAQATASPVPSVGTQDRDFQPAELLWALRYAFMRILEYVITKTERVQPLRFGDSVIEPARVPLGAVVQIEPIAHY